MSTEGNNKQGPIRATTTAHKAEKEKKKMNMNMNGSRINDMIDHANRKLRSITEIGFPVSFEDVRMSADVDEETGEIVVTSGGEEIASGTFAEAKAAVWSKVDAVRSEVEAIGGSAEEAAPQGRVNYGHHHEHAEKPKREWLSDFDFLVKRVSEIAEMANNRLAEIVAGGYPFSIEEVKVAVSTDTAGMYVMSGSTPLVSVPMSKTDSIREIKSKIWEMVDSVRSTVERRVAQKADADSLAAESGQIAKAAEALRAAGIDTSVLGGGVNLDAAKAVADAAKKAVRAANRGVYLYYGDVCDALYGGRKGSLLVVKGYAGGIVVLAGGKPCLVTRFPKVSNNSTVERTIAFIESDIKAISESRRRYFQTVKSELEKAQLMHEKAAAIDAANADIAAAM